MVHKWITKGMWVLFFSVFMFTRCPSSTFNSEAELNKGDVTDASKEDVAINIITNACLSDKDCEKGVCNPNTHTCVICFEDKHCKPSEKCIENQCKEQEECNNNGECKFGVCDISTGKCVECASDVDCKTGYSCEAGVCVFKGNECNSDEDCENGMKCDQKTGKCVFCADSPDCSEDKYCYKGECKPDVCKPYEKVCVSNKVMQCKYDGGGWFVFKDCTKKAMYCENGMCKKNVVCTPGFTTCLDEKNKLVCNDEGTGFTKYECMQGSFCKDGECVSGCVPNCKDKECGGDGCGGSCGECGYLEQCVNFKCLGVFLHPCETGADCISGVCVLYKGGKVCSKECKDSCDNPDFVCKEKDPGNPEAGFICVYKECTPNCNGKECGDNGCGGLCGICAEGETCVNGKCEKGCIPSCDGKECGDDGCGGSCGICNPAEYCINGKCEKKKSCSEANDCFVNCLEGNSDLPKEDMKGCMAECDDYLAQGEDESFALLVNCVIEFCFPEEPGVEPIDCYSQAIKTACKEGYNNCVGCIPDCTGKECGDDGCGGICGVCPENYWCSSDGKCVNECDGITYEGCCDGETLKYCENGKLVTVNCLENPKCGWDFDNNYYDCGTSGKADPSGQHPKSCSGACIPDCAGKECGSNGCGGVCGTCLPDETCVNGKCKKQECTPDCAGKQCGPDGCGGFCGVCADGFFCNMDGKCVPSCIPVCNGKECGPDGCGGSCGVCGYDEYCSNGKCEEFVTCMDTLNCYSKCAPGDEQCNNECYQKASPEAKIQLNALWFCLVDVCGTDAPPECYSSAYFDQCKDYYYACVNCTPNCAGKECGNDGCGGECGKCLPGSTCTSSYLCSCIPQCNGKECGPDGCGGLCGKCKPGEVCSTTGKCVCIPQCAGKECGPDGCGGSCGKCGTNEVCKAGKCEKVCVPDCTGKECGDDGCGGSCGVCPDGEMCVYGKCEKSCLPSCAGKECGSDGCGGSCGNCPDGFFCGGKGKCIPQCIPDCKNKECGPDGCGGSCGYCSVDFNCVNGKCKEFVSCADILNCTWSCPEQDEACKQNCFKSGSPDAKIQWMNLVLCLQAVCGDSDQNNCYAKALIDECKDQYYECIECTPNCEGKQCGADGCGGSCGTCAPGVKCDDVWGLCECVPNCENKECGPDGCGGLCGTCAPNEVCNPLGKCVCLPECKGKQCGPDGCGGSCGTCPPGHECNFGKCVQ